MPSDAIILSDFKRNISTWRRLWESSLTVAAEQYNLREIKKKEIRKLEPKCGIGQILDLNLLWDL